MICENCIHIVVCKEVDNFKEYQRQHKRMREVSSLPDKPIECPCYLGNDNLDSLKVEAKETNNKLRKTIAIAEITKLKNKVDSVIEGLEGMLVVYPKVLKFLKKEIENGFDQIVDDVRNI